MIPHLTLSGSRLLLFFIFGVSAVWAGERAAEVVRYEPLPWVEWGAEENLVLGKPVRYLRLPDRLANRGNEETKLTDGKISGVVGEAIWNGYQRQYAAWNSATQGVGFSIDLGGPERVGKVALRLTGGKPSGGAGFPSEIIIVASNDGETYYAVARSAKVTEGERSLAVENPERFYFRPEDGGETYVDTFVFTIAREARYVGVLMRSSSALLAVDEVAIQRAGEDVKVQALDGTADSVIAFGAASITPQSPDAEVVMTTNAMTPNWFHVSGLKEEEERSFRFTLPPGVILTTGQQLKASRVEKEGAVENEWVVSGPLYRRMGNNILGPIFFSLQEGEKLPKDAVIAMKIEGEESSLLRRPFRAVAIPDVPRLERFEVSLGWTREVWASEHPDFMKLYRQAGFNIYPLFPYYAYRSGHEGRLIERAMQARAQKMKVLAITSPIMYYMDESHGNHPEVFNVINGAPGRRICPSYQGEQYQDILRRYRGWMESVKPDVVFYDIEDYRSWSLEEAKQCSRCKEAFAASGLKSWDDFLVAQGTRIMSDLRKATDGVGLEGITPDAGLYDVRPVPARYDIFDFNKLHSAGVIQFGQPHLYLAGDLEKIHERLRENYLATGQRLLIPWLTGGTFGEFSPYKMEQIVLECFLNGVRGITYYRYDDLDPMDFYYHALALQRLAPYEKLLSEGKLLEVEADNQRLRTSAFGGDHQALLLVGNYSESSNTRTSISLPGRIVEKVRDLISGDTLETGALASLEVTPGGHRLLELTFAKPKE